MSNSGNYIKISVELNTEGQDTAEILVAELAEAGAESFDEEPNLLNAYFPEQNYQSEIVEKIFSNNIFSGLKYSASIMKPQNWNEIWESNFHPVIVGNKCVIYAPFHSDLPEVEYKILISPEMTFGTGHHETTHLMLEALLGCELKSLSMLDMGCGTGILAILAIMKGATLALAVDNDVVAVENTRKNMELNKVADRTEVIHGDSSVLKNRSFDLIAANINRNVLLNDMSLYAKSLNKEGSLIISGFYKQDIPLLEQEAISVGLKSVKTRERNGWAMMVLDF
ncbi:MAG: 50S ribosomal protein L11 methyltransferase [Prevotellaceae bacterium]|jgi:ribosomal protein L11 methyltransferase|nr:50S ribosomal protein L11 methyltransferase [Prevotellaceae bacterium]